MNLASRTCAPITLYSIADYDIIRLTVSLMQKVLWGYQRWLPCWDHSDRLRA